MIRVERSPEPERFKERCQAPGNEWLVAHPGQHTKAPAYWTEFKADLRRAFGERCGWLAMWNGIGLQTANSGNYRGCRIWQDSIEQWWMSASGPDTTYPVTCSWLCLY